MQSSTVRLSSVPAEIGGRPAVCHRLWCPTVQPGMGSMTVVVTLEIKELPLQIHGRPEERPVQTFTPNCTNQPFHERMREWRVRHRLDVLHGEDPQIGLPLM